MLLFALPLPLFRECFSKPTRRTAPPALGVCEISAVFDGWLDGRGNRDLERLLRRCKSESWKTAPVAATLAHYWDLYSQLAVIAPHCILPIKRTEQEVSNIEYTKQLRLNLVTFTCLTKLGL